MNTLDLYHQGLNGTDLVDAKRGHEEMDRMDPHPQLRTGQHVQLNTPDNVRLHGAIAQVVRPTEWGAHVTTDAAASGQFRATHEEMVLLREVEVDATRQARDEGYTGDCCSECGSFKMKRNGACLVCCACGASGGCG